MAVKFLVLLQVDCLLALSVYLCVGIWCQSLRWQCRCIHSTFSIYLSLTFFTWCCLRKHILVRFLSGRSVWDVDNPEHPRCLQPKSLDVIPVYWNEDLTMDDRAPPLNACNVRTSRFGAPIWYTCNFLALSSCERMKENFFGWGFGCANQQQWCFLQISPTSVIMPNPCLF